MTPARLRLSLALAGCAALTAASLAAPAEAKGRRGSEPNPVLKCLGADCNDVAWRRGKKRGPNVVPCAVEAYTVDGDETFRLVPGRYCVE